MSEDKKSILDTKTFGECRTDSELMANSIKAYLLENGYSEEVLPSEFMIRRIFTTFCATVAIRTEIAPSIPMRRVVEAWDNLMMDYSKTRMANEFTQFAKDQPRVIVP